MPRVFAFSLYPHNRTNITVTTLLVIKFIPKGFNNGITFKFNNSTINVNVNILSSYAKAYAGFIFEVRSAIKKVRIFGDGVVAGWEIGLSLLRAGQCK